jgi:hypothetical protein
MPPCTENKARCNNKDNYVGICLPHFSRTVFKSQVVQTESSWTAFTLKMGPTGFAEISVNSYKHLLHKNQEE